MENCGIEPELNAPPPRRVRRRGTRGFGTLFSQFLIFPIIVLALLLPLWCLDLVMVRVSGPIIPCQIVARYQKADSHDEVRYFLKYRATINGKQQTQQKVVARQIYEATPIGTKTRVQVSPWWPGFDSVLLLPGQNVWEDVVLGVLGSFIMLVVVGVLVWFIYLVPGRRRNLVVRGVPTVGRVFDKSKYVGRDVQAYYLYYEYWPPDTETGTTKRWVGQQQVRRTEWEAPQIGDSGSVLYDPKNPAWSVLYRYGDYEVVG